MSQVIRKTFTVKPDQDAGTSKALTLELDFTGVEEDALREMVLPAIVIKVQQSLRGDKAWSSLKDGDVISRSASDFIPRGSRMDPKEFMKARLNKELKGVQKGSKEWNEIVSRVMGI